MYSELFASLQTTEDRRLLLRELDLLLQSLYKQNDQSFEKISEESVRGSTMTHLEKIFQANPDKDAVLKEIKKLLEGVNIVELTIALEPTRQLTDRVSGWVKKNLSEDALIRFEIDKKIVAGAKIIYKGAYHDFSTSKKIVELTSNGKQS